MFSSESINKGITKKSFTKIPNSVSKRLPTFQKALIVDNAFTKSFNSIIESIRVQVEVQVVIVSQSNFFLEASKGVVS